MINNTSLQKWERLKAKNLDSQFTHEIIHGLNCSPFEAKAVLEAMHRIYDNQFDTTTVLQPGQIKFVVISVETSPACSLSDADKITVTLTLDHPSDLEKKEKGGVIALRHHRLQRICNEALMQGGILTVEDIANRIFCCGERTVIRDIKSFKDNGIILPLRSSIKDMGRTLSHRKLIIEKWLDGSEYSHIVRATNHSIDAINNYIGKFKQVVALANEDYDVTTIAFLTKISKPLAQTYIDLWKQAKMIDVRRQELETLVTKKKYHP